jgi:hypothetical protein
MDAKTLNTIGLVLNIVGVAIVFCGFPQPTHEEGVLLGLEDGTTLGDGRTVAQHNEEIRKIKARYIFISRLALG